jgi:hypothetical protein
MPEQSPRILQVGTAERGGGAASVAASLARGYRTRGYEVWTAVGQKDTGDSRVFLIPDDDSTLSRITGYLAVQNRLKQVASRFPGMGWGSLS